MTGIIDDNGFRLNVGIIIAGRDGRVFWGRRMGNRDAWQFPQGGMMPGETPEETLFRELEEEVGLRPEHVEIIASTEGWLSYRLPRRFLRRPLNRPDSRPHCIGQRQKWFLLRLTAAEEAIDLFATDSPEFKAWRWVNYWYPIRKVVHFKRGVYARALRELAPALKKEVGSLSGKKGTRQCTRTAKPGGASDA
ncbi:(di)nucleoside polyphosphate hydrolase [Alcanivorax sp. MD8A]|uniref:RNA pyrophosphohydrolase n=1 Tax=Alcanivorax sp. MD8A TaxID=1177157 RepID=UPI000CAD41DA|nr:(di)nucleoside polyphosphate hydrolase [Alcanivorax sp. MD8A]|tara:strand:+ start:6309 stop:6887 length:579 start_codon:yes stop_codon:yes gene_type:complete